MQLTLLDRTAGNWNLQIEDVIKRLPVTGQPFHFPLYFLQSTLPRIGGKVALYGENGNDFAVGFLSSDADSPVRGNRYTRCAFTLFPTHPQSLSKPSSA